MTDNNDNNNSYEDNNNKRKRDDDDYNDNHQKRIRGSFDQNSSNNESNKDESVESGSNHDESVESESNHEESVENNSNHEERAESDSNRNIDSESDSNHDIDSESNSNHEDNNESEVDLGITTAIERSFENLEVDQLHEMRKEILSKGDHIDAEFEDLVARVDEAAEQLHANGVISEGVYDSVKEISEDICHVVESGIAWRDEKSRDDSIGDAELLDEVEPAYEKNRQEYSIDALQSQLDILQEAFNENPGSLPAPFSAYLDLVSQRTSELKEITGRYWEERQEYHNLEKEKTNRDQGSLLDDYADPSLEQPSHMDPDD